MIHAEWIHWGLVYSCYRRWVNSCLNCLGSVALAHKEDERPVGGSDMEGEVVKRIVGWREEAAAGSAAGEEGLEVESGTHMPGPGGPGALQGGRTSGAEAARGAGLG